MSTRKYLIWAVDHRAWWGPNHCGYVFDPADAGRYSGEEVAEILATDMLNEQRGCREDAHESMAARVTHDEAKSHV